MRAWGACCIALVTLGRGALGLEYELAFEEPADALCAKPAAIAQCSLVRSTDGVLLRLVRWDIAAAEERIVARSYDGHAWEGLNPVPVDVACPSPTAACEFEYDPFKYEYSVKKVTVTEPVGIKHNVAKLLTQATFGARKMDIDGFDHRGAADPDAAGEWVDLQADREPLLMRTYLRRRSNPRNLLSVGDVFEPCEVGARWHQYAFNRDDWFMRPGGAAPVTVTAATGGKVLLALNGQPLTEMAAADFGGSVGTYYVCKVAERDRVGGTVELRANANCGGAMLSIQNPPISFTDDSTLPMFNADDPAKAQFVSLADKGIDNVVVTTLVNVGTCDGEFSANNGGLRWNETVYFVKYDFKLFRYDPRLKMYSNTLDAPTPVSNGNAWTDHCPSAPMNFLNANTCDGTSACSAGNGRACGSRGEVENDPTEGNMYSLYPTGVDDDYYFENLDQGQRSDDQKTQLFHNIALYQETHQLRYRVAWALMQIIPVSQGGIGKERATEVWATYMDLFVANAFGNFHDLIKEVSYSSAMGRFLTFIGNRGFATAQTLPDQNYAREIMQLFTIGLYELNMDGSAKLDAAGKEITTYGTHDIVTFSRAWTGFVAPSRRGNVENFEGNDVDPMKLKGENRDTFPKANLRGGYIGDGYPLCSELPEKHFLQEGAVYVFSGEESVEEGGFDDVAEVEVESVQPVGYDFIVADPIRLNCGGGSSCDDPNGTNLGYYELYLEPLSSQVRDAVSLPELYIHGDNLSLMRIYHVTWFAVGTNRLQFRPYGVHTPTTDYAQFERDFHYMFPPGTNLTFTNSPDPILPGATREVLQHFSPPPSHPLFQTLCDGPLGSCSRRPQIVLGADITCAGDSQCEALEDMKTVKLQSAGETLYYHYVKPACVSMAVFAGQVTSSKDADNQEVKTRRQCADPRLTAAGATCCRQDRTGEATSLTTNYKPPQCQVLGEVMSFATAAARCEAEGLSLCSDFAKASNRWTSCGYRMPQWMSTPCTLKVQVRLDGAISLVADPDTPHDARFVNGTQNKNTFYPVWVNGAFPTVASGDCEAADGDTLICPTEIDEEVIFSALPSLADAEHRLTVGAFDPARYGARYACAPGVDCDTSTASTEVVAYLHQDVAPGDSPSFDGRAIIGVRVPDRFGGGFRYYLNRAEWVSVNGFMFRNAPTFMPFAGEKPVDRHVPAEGRLAVASRHAAAHETDAVIKHLVRHENTAPFISHLLIQRLVTSNPSPRYIEVVANAFATGRYGTRGSGLHGCMKATITALLLDREARSTTLDADPGHGVSREPLLKILQVLRAQEVRADNGGEVRTFPYNSMGSDIFHAPSVFGFYLPTNKPSGPLADRGLVSPEATLNIAPMLFKMLDRLGDLFTKGLCRDTFGQESCNADDRIGVVHFDPIPGVTDFPTEVTNKRIIDELDLVLTDGRLSQESKSIILDEMTHWVPPFEVDLLACPTDYELDKRCEQANQGTCPEGDVCRMTSNRNRFVAPRGCTRVNTAMGAVDAVVGSLACVSTPDAEYAREQNMAIARQLIVLMPEFHVSNLRMPEANKVRNVTALERRKGGNGYKAVVGIMLNGGCDSFSYLVPGDASKCGANGERVSYQQYEERRGVVKKNLADLLAITPLNGHEQPCTEFYVNKNLSAVHQAFEDGHGAWFPNVGNLVQPVTRAHKRNRAGKKFPPFLFAHNFQQKHSGTLHAQEGGAKGVMGRIARAYQSVGRTNIYSIDSYRKITTDKTYPATVLSRRSGTVKLRAYEKYERAIDRLIAMPSLSYFAETYQDVVQRSVGISKELQHMLDDIRENGTSYPTWPNTAIAEQLNTAGQIMRLRDENGEHISDRDLFAMGVGGFDTHFVDYPGAGTPQLNAALAAFREEMEGHGMWEDVVVVTYSDFARTITSNGQGTDHAWGGNYFAIGGSIKDKVMLSSFVESMDADGHDLDWGNGIVIPKWGYEVYWGPIVDWFGVPSEQWYEVLPNLPYFPPICKFDLFDAPAGANTTCVMPEAPDLPTPEPAPPGTPAPPVDLSPLGAYTEVCAYRAVTGTPLANFGYTLGRVGAQAAIEFRMTVDAGNWAAVGLRDHDIAHRGMEGIDITAVDTDVAAVQDYEVTLFASAPDMQPLTQTQLTVHGEVNGVYEIAFYRLLNNMYDHPIVLDEDVNLAVAHGVGPITGSWRMHSRQTAMNVMFEGCGEELVPPGTTPNPAAPTPPPGTPGTPSNNTDANGTTPGGPGSVNPGNKTLSGTNLGAALEEGQDGGFPVWLIAVIAAGVLLLCAVIVVLVRRCRGPNFQTETMTSCFAPESGVELEEQFASHDVATPVFPATATSTPGMDLISPTVPLPQALRKHSAPHTQQSSRRPSAASSAKNSPALGESVADPLLEESVGRPASPSVASAHSNSDVLFRRSTELPDRAPPAPLLAVKPSKPRSLAGATATGLLAAGPALHRTVSTESNVSGGGVLLSPRKSGTGIGMVSLLDTIKQRDEARAQGDALLAPALATSSRTLTSTLTDSNAPSKIAPPTSAYKSSALDDILL